MEIIKFNKANWTGEETTLVWNPENSSFVISGLEEEGDWTLVKHEDDEGVHYDLTNPDWELPLFRVYEMQHDSPWHMAVSGDYTREDRHPAVAAAQMILFTV